MIRKHPPQAIDRNAFRSALAARMFEELAPAPELEEPKPASASPDVVEVPVDPHALAVRTVYTALEALPDNVARLRVLEEVYDRF